MLFQTLEYAAFFFITATLILLIENNRIQKVLLLIASIYFYSVGSLMHLPLFLTVICFTYVMSRVLQKYHKKWLLALTITLSFVPLFIYKYLPSISFDQKKYTCRVIWQKFYCSICYAFYSS